MKLHSNTVLITGGATGIGLAMAERFLKAGSEVIICGRRESALAETKAKHPKLHTRVCDIARCEDRLDLLRWATQAFPALNVLVNNAGIQRRVDLATAEDWEITREEIAINLEAPIHLSRIFIPHLTAAREPTIINVTSGLSFSPLASVPVYSATKAALHSFTLSLRHQLSNIPIEVLEVAPPAVDTDLGGKGLHTFGVNLDEFADSVFKDLEKGEREVTFGFSAQSSRASRSELDAIFKKMNSSWPPL